MQQVLHRGAAFAQHKPEDVLDASWDDLKSFLACARYKSFRNAADLLGVTSTTLMRRIDRLEERIIQLGDCEHTEMDEGICLNCGIDKRP